MWVIELIESFSIGAEAVATHKTLRMQDGYLGGRTLEPSPGNPGWWVQAFFDCETDSDNTITTQDDLPRGVKLVYLPVRLRKWLGIK